MVAWKNIFTYAVVIGVAGLVLTQQSQPPDTKREVEFPQTSNQQSLLAEPEKPQSPDTNSPKLLKFKLSVSSPQDLRVKQGDRVAAGQVLADRVQERSRLTSQRKFLQLSLQQIKSALVATPSSPQSVPAVKQLPPIVYAEEEAAIASARINVAQVERAFQLQQQSLNSEPLPESSAVARAAVEVENRQHLVNNQLRKIDAVALLKGLPDGVKVHEQEVLQQKQADLQQAQADYEQTQAKLDAASQAQTEKLLQLSAALEQARAEQHLAIAKLQSKKDQRAYTEYQANVTAAERAEERNQAQQSYSSQLQEAEQQERERHFQVAQLQAKLAEVDNQLQALGNVTSPYAGLIRQLKVTGQNEQNLLVEITLLTGSNRPD